MFLILYGRGGSFVRNIVIDLVRAVIYGRVGGIEKALLNELVVVGVVLYFGLGLDFLSGGGRERSRLVDRGDGFGNCGARLGNNFGRFGALCFGTRTGTALGYVVRLVLHVGKTVDGQDGIAVGYKAAEQIARALELVFVRDEDFASAVGKRVILALAAV